MKAIRTLFAAIAAAMMLNACQPQGVTELSSFVRDDTVRLEIDGVRVFSYDESLCQMALNAARGEFRVHDDTMSEFFIITMDKLPQAAGDRVNASILWTESGYERDKQNVTLVARSIRGDVIWLCDDSQRNAAVIRMLE